ncbi:MAG: GntR family transcriptional regulator [Burkholderiaceae bacterium]|nr:MAG: GntR family transcriptional regulator [Burkholderiaceae bacterium]
MPKISDTLYADLRRRLMSGYYAPGAWLREEHIAEEMKVSRTPVRAALQRLVEDGLLVAAARGATVAQWTQWDVAEVFELRMLLEPHAAGLAAERATPEQVAEMEALNDEMERWVKSRKDDRVARVQAVNNRFHHLLVEAARSGRLKALLQNYLDMPIMIGSFYFYSEQEMRESVEHHRQVTLAIRRRDRRFAEQAMAFHLRASFVRFEMQRVGAEAAPGAAPIPAPGSSGG